MTATSQLTPGVVSKSRSKDTKKTSESVITTIAVTEEITEKKKRKNDTIQQVPELDSEMKDRKPEKKKKSPRTELKEDISEEKKHKRKRKDSDDSTQTTPGDDSVAPPARKEEKRKKRKRVAEAEKETKEKEEPVAKKRKHRNKTGLPDPEEDESLTEQSQKALSYAFLQFYRPKKWKFNKARQNWIIRNLWSVEAVPDVYQPLILKYMSHVQGGVRENLIKTCRSILDEQKPVPVPDTNIAPAVGGVLVESDTSAPLTDVKVSRAKVLLATLTKTES